MFPTTSPGDVAGKRSNVHDRILSPKMAVRKIRSWLVGMLSRTKVRYYRFMGTTIGKNCYVSPHACIDSRRGRITIGDNVSISSGSYILGHVGFRELKEGQETVLEDNVKVFVNAVVLPGVRIGRNSIVGAGAVVGKDVPANVVVMGNPARVVEQVRVENGVEGCCRMGATGGQAP